MRACFPNVFLSVLIPLNLSESSLNTECCFSVFKGFFDSSFWLIHPCVQQRPGNPLGGCQLLPSGWAAAHCNTSTLSRRRNHLRTVWAPISWAASSTSWAPCSPRRAACHQQLLWLLPQHHPASTSYTSKTFWHFQSPWDQLPDTWLGLSLYFTVWNWHKKTWTAAMLIILFVILRHNKAHSKYKAMALFSWLWKKPRLQCLHVSCLVFEISSLINFKYHIRIAFSR